MGFSLGDATRTKKKSGGSDKKKKSSSSRPFCSAQCLALDGAEKEQKGEHNAWERGDVVLLRREGLCLQKWESVVF